NAGASFTGMDGSHPDNHAAVWDAAGRLVIGCDGGVYRSSNGATFSSLNTGLGTIQLYAGVSTHPTNADFVLAGAQDNGTNRRSSNSLVWESLLGGDGGWTQLDRTNPLRLFAESQGTGALARSDDG